MLHIFHGEDEYSLEKAVLQLRSTLGPEDMASLNTTLIADADVTPMNIITACDTVPFMTSARLVIVTNVMGKVQSPRGQRKQSPQKDTPSAADTWKPLIEYLPQMPESTELVLKESSVAKNNPLFKALQPIAKIQEFRPLTREKTEAWIRARAKTYDADIDPRAVRNLADSVGNDLRSLENEIEKLILFSSGRLITEEDINLLVSSAKETNIFAFVDNFIDGKYPVARTQLHQLQNDGVGIERILAMIYRGVRMLIQARDLVDRREPKDQMKRLLGTNSDFVINKVTQQARQYTKEDLMAMHENLVAYDLAIKTGRLSAETAIELLVSRSRKK